MLQLLQQVNLRLKGVCHKKGILEDKKAAHLMLQLLQYRLTSG